jgi:hypothetical protein
VISFPNLRFLDDLYAGNLGNGAFLIRTDRKTSGAPVCGGDEALEWIKVTLPLYYLWTSVRVERTRERFPVFTSATISRRLLWLLMRSSLIAI